MFSRPENIGFFYQKLSYILFQNHVFGVLFFFISERAHFSNESQSQYLQNANESRIGRKVAKSGRKKSPDLRFPP
jgi:hypothetical protein